MLRVDTDLLHPTKPEVRVHRSDDTPPRPERRVRRRRSVPTNVLIPVQHREALKRLSERTRVSQSEYLREAVSDLLEKYLEVLDRSDAA